MRLFEPTYGPPPDLPALRRLLQADGLALVPAEPGDVEGRTMRRVVAELGTADPHHTGGKDMWDIRYRPAAGGGCTRSLTLQSFPYHTDGSFEEPPPRYIALYVVREDRFGGGATLLLEVAAVLPHVSAGARQTLRSTRFRFRVPAEFDKGVPYCDAPILFGDGLLRYRREIIDESDCGRAQVAALDELDAAIAATEPARLSLPSGTLLLLDNARFLHARTEVRDPERHLLRMRFSSSRVGAFTAQG
jgi:alpha-ketoglutarate-dependent taurine dioxygenase